MDVIHDKSFLCMSAREETGEGGKCYQIFHFKCGTDFISVSLYISVSVCLKSQWNVPAETEARAQNLPLISMPVTLGVCLR